MVSGVGVLLPFPGIPDYMEIFPGCARIVSACVVQDDPLRYVPITCAYEDLGPGRVRTRLKPDSDWREYFFRMEGEIILWTWEGKEWPWEPISDDELPGWFRGFETKARQRFDEREAAAAARRADGMP